LKYSFLGAAGLCDDAGELEHGGKLLPLVPKPRSALFDMFVFGAAGLFDDAGELKCEGQRLQLHLPARHVQAYARGHHSRSTPNLNLKALHNTKLTLKSSYILMYFTIKICQRKIF
jgi:hypothetical protein